MPEPSPSLSLILPAYNEEARLARTLDTLLASARVGKGASEILVVDDGSTDGTATIARAYAERHPSIRLLRHENNRGKGYSVRRGFREARGEVVLFTDVDMSIPFSEADKLLRALRHGADVAIGSRGVDRAQIRVQRPLFRALLSHLFRLLSFLILGLPFKDTQCGFKAFRRERAQSLFDQQRVERFAFDAELLFLATKEHLRVAEIGINCDEARKSKVRLFLDGARMLIDLLRVRWWWLSGGYEKGRRQ
ncbi:MAG: dolichyl-phosphate beta-glucosyltransferase [Terriglobia bacterium]